MNFAQITLMGNVGRDPDVSYSSDGTAVTRFSLAITHKEGKDGKGKTTWYACTAFRALAEAIAEYVRKGDPLFVLGELHPRGYTDKEVSRGPAWMCWWRNFTCSQVSRQRHRKRHLPRHSRDKTAF